MLATFHMIPSIWGAPHGGAPVCQLIMGSMDMDIGSIMKSAMALGILAASGFVRDAAAETVNCTNITSLPATITTQGVYCLKQHLPTNLASGNAITVMVSNVTIDCNDFKIGNLQAGPATQATGIGAGNQFNITVRNCGIRGFRNGVSLTNGLYRVENNRFDNNTQTAINVSGDGTMVSGNEIVDTGASTIGGIADFHGIVASGDVDIVGNNITGVVATTGGGGNAYGIRTLDMDSGIIRNNLVRNLVDDGAGLRRGIWVQNGNHNMLFGNSVVMDGDLLIGEAGIRCGDGLILNGAARDNTILGVGLLGGALALLNCTDIDLNHVNPL